MSKGNYFPDTQSFKKRLITVLVNRLYMKD